MERWNNAHAKGWLLSMNIATKHFDWPRATWELATVPLSVGIVPLYVEIVPGSVGKDLEKVFSAAIGA